ncbi:hypothetical protein N656DRAFT_774756 [Canariomyces notabilis]|uniref:Uncharacterized protein n=1 Tax=Canariomyces notabilis TaxID=2074819 RepID=A0AAN6YWC1_9PEZI|nr:hypothetical protein N656DRAFT_774756 [Canariomyces arenarius]
MNLIDPGRDADRDGPAMKTSAQPSPTPHNVLGQAPGLHQVAPSSRAQLQHHRQIPLKVAELTTVYIASNQSLSGSTLYSQLLV